MEGVLGWCGHRHFGGVIVRELMPGGQGVVALAKRQGAAFKTEAAWAWC